MLKQQEVLIDSIYNLGKLVNPELVMDEVRRILVVKRKQETEGLGNKGFSFTGKRLSETEALPEEPEVTLTDLDTSLQIRDCHMDDTYKFSEDGRVYDDMSNGYIKPNEDSNQTTFQLTINRTVINVPEDFVRYYVTTTDMEQANKLLEDELLKVRNKTATEESKRKEELRKQLLQKEQETKSERYLYHKETTGMRLAHTPYILTAEGRVYDTEIGRLRAVNNRGYTTSLNKGFKTPINLSFNNIKNILENQDFTILIERAGYTEDQCNSMWDDYQKQLQLKDESEHEEDNQNKDNKLDEVALKEGFVRGEDGYFIHKSRVAN